MKKKTSLILSNKSMWQDHLQKIPWQTHVCHKPIESTESRKRPKDTGERVICVLSEVHSFMEYNRLSYLIIIYTLRVCFRYDSKLRFGDCSKKFEIVYINLEPVIKFLLIYFTFYEFPAKPNTTQILPFYLYDWYFYQNFSTVWFWLCFATLTASPACVSYHE